ncbi:response regulator [Dyadobacter subterraneus]|uniref:Response regulator n=1 Tax=Dyadobacter subterraneus TaxID=2773304 RepID=A0ABR9W7Y6_9BACT|nr:response regulator [Dyadobacter subterraneus]MBE9461587.1 response regulator [Dyadobacter subterraneus]
MGEIEIYLADDDEDDRLFLKEAINLIIPGTTIIEATDGQNLVDLISFKSGNLTLILVDMNMPRLNGLEAISIIKSQPELKNIPTLMVSTSQDAALRKQAYQLGISTFITKPTTMDGYENIARGIKICFVDQFISGLDSSI